MNMVRKLSALCIGSALLFTTQGAIAQTFRAADVHPADYPNVVAVKHMGEKLKTATDGRLEIKTFPGGVLGDEKQTIEQAQIGAIDIIRVSMTPVAAILPEINVFTLPYIFRDEDHMHKVLDGMIGKEIGDRLTASKQSRLVFLGWMDAGTRNLITKAPLAKAEDLNGMKIRVQASPVSLDTLKAMGANPVAMGVSEVFSGMQTGVVDGTENNPPTYVAHNYLPVAKNYTWSKHFIIPELFLFSKVKWDKLKKEDQELIIKLAKEAQAEQRELWQIYNAKSLETMKANGVNFQDVDIKYYYTATQSVRDKYGKDHQELIKRIQDVQ
ncbi:TRAP transporter substrate-binding protein [Shimwellia blattae]|uniref:Putative TRAP dicarboxylate transporter n=1 Tax=Shimwellia blattae (strain ATCC 29907 / DSM 4481 / JCM 1650 / NBRC 105725 / CDC 9005-74) TaxID=630626 RepID=I2BDG1_SHIBC|nr:TRAP transporter substrate-binding protein [Shimwellia blattae]AFJ48565.1 putative TRAP dicarboxylate transporter [Shimwellia blattae DSM 4481 = NBRC 105725]GAB81399.1 2,3-diketo-L-gulonate transporter periplasmic protein YiaO [Shimwellia blattae DSM 4481 = NBRC 105725]VDY66055.1 Extracytoplasmic solute receptor protein yiaO [Shimwellia blattae]VEC26789.1 Extracytoplasmic solute receptor protein yiaO [Shimwellia blattae]